MSFDLSPSPVPEAGFRSRGNPLSSTPPSESVSPDLQQRLRELEEKERRYHALFNGTFQLSGTISCDGILTDANSSALRLVGAELADVVGLPFVETPWWSHSPVEQHRLREGIRAACQGEFVRFETSHVDGQGQRHYIDFSLNPVFDSNGEVGYLIAEGRDITAHEEASRELLRLKNLYAVLSRVNHALLHARDEGALLQTICEIAAGQEEIPLAWIGFRQDGSTRIEPLAWAGEALAAIHDFFLDIDCSEPVPGSLTSIENRPLVIDSLLDEPGFLPWRDILKHYRLFSLAAFPLSRRGDEMEGILVVYAGTPGYFHGGTLGLFEEMAQNTSYALGVFAREQERRRAEEALTRSESRYRELVENANSVILRLDPQGRVTFFNEFAERLLGFDRQEVLGRPAWETFVPVTDDSGRNLKRMLEQLLLRPEDYRYNVNQNLCRDGSRVWIAWTNKVIEDDTGQVREILSIGHDITAERQQAELLERKASEEEIRNALLRLALEPISLQEFLQQSLRQIVLAPWLGLLPQGGIFLCTGDGREMFLAADYHFTAEQRDVCTRVRFGEHLCGKVAAECRAYFGEQLEEPFARLLNNPKQDQNVLPLLAGDELLGVLTVYLPTGRPRDVLSEAFLSGAADILAIGISRRQTEMTLRQHDALMQRLIDTIPIPIYYKDTELIYQGCNDYFARDILALPKSAIVGKNMYDIAPEDLARVYEEADLELLRSGETQVYHTEVRYADGCRHGVIIHKAVIMREDGTPYGIVGAILDITEHQKLQEQLRHAQKVEALGTLTGGIAHDFNNILTAIMGYASILQLKLARDSEMGVIVNQILDTTEKAANLTYSLLTYSRKQVAKPKAIDINQAICGIETMLRRVLPETIEFATRLCEETLMVLADQPQLEQVLVNMATNARDAMPSGGRLEIRSEALVIDESFVRQQGFGAPSNYVRLTVSDNGEGIPEEIVDRIFDPFFTTKQVGRGTGLGLSISYGIIKQHHGHIRVESKPGKGTVFSIYLPLTEHDGTAAEETARLLPVGGSELILVVEDDDAVRQVSRAVLEEVGYKVLVAADGQEALDLYRQRGSEIDLVLTDIIMPRMTGLELFQEIRKHDPAVRILFTSGYTFDALEDHGIEEGEVDIIFKPVAPLELLDGIRRLLDGSKSG
ncbi:hypothetical protein B5V00_09800 [Geothermobacter hydrogeniphilus]|uniref:histidine kinase n=1 Tax=Geothermobacter hydrogeniphilus TaxID=1969733 RepID=A0A1X0Y390_9BACT|nr:hypothetical protein B5V00_09800 [Geothermobacter hydrogeniphilus]